MTSVCRRRSEPSQEAMMSAAVMPLPGRSQGMSRAGPATLVARVTRWRMPGRWRSQRPMKVSVAPAVAALGGTGYISAVSRKVTPRSTARSSMACASASPTCSPKVMVPRQMGGTRSGPRAMGVRGFMGRLMPAPPPRRRPFRACPLCACLRWQCRACAGPGRARTARPLQCGQRLRAGSG